MGTSLSGLTPKDTYPALLKTTANTAIDATLRTISDGLGNDTPLQLSTLRVGVKSDSTVTTQTSSVIQATTTNANLVIAPNGTGAIVASIPDGTAAGGNARGSNAVDLQTLRVVATQVASGRDCVIAGGNNNTSSGEVNVVGGGSNNNTNGIYSVISGGLNNSINYFAATGSTISGGSTNTISERYDTIAGGLSNTVSSQYSTVSGGQTNTASTNTHATVVGGQSNTSSGQNSVNGGRSNTASGDYASVFGNTNNVSGLGAFSAGTNNTVSGTRGVGIGQSISVAGANGVAFGAYASAANAGSIAIGNEVYAEANYSSAIGFRSNTKLFAQNSYSAGMFTNAGDAQQSLLTARKLDTLTTAATTVLSLDGTGITNLIIPYGNNRAWNVQVNWVAVVTTITGTATGITVGDVVTSIDLLAFKKIGGVSSASAHTSTATKLMVTTPAAYAACAIAFTAGASQEMELTFTGPTFVGGGSVTMRVVARIELTEVAF